MNHLSTKTNSRLILFITFLAACASTVYALSPGHFASSSKLATNGKWVKIRCTEPGMQEIPYDSLRAWGFDDPAKVRVYGFSTAPLATNQLRNELPDDLPMIRTLRWPEINPQKLIFYNAGAITYVTGKANVNATINHYADYASYLLTDSRYAEDGDDGLETAFYNSRTKSTAESIHRSLEYVKPREFHPSLGGVFYYGKPFTDETTYSFTLIDPCTTSSSLSSYGNGRFFYSVTLGDISNHVAGALPIVLGSTDAVTVVSTKNASVQNTSMACEFLSSAAGEMYFKPKDASVTVPVQLTATLSANAKAVSSWAAHNYHGVTYLRKNIIRDDVAQLRMYFDFISTRTDDTNILIPRTAAELDNPTQTVSLSAPLLWDVTNPEMPYSMNLYTQSANWVASFAPTTTGASLTPQVMAFRPNLTLHRPRMERTVNPQNLHSLEAADMLIISTEGMFDAAKELANLHKELQGMDVAVVTHEQAINEFSSGTPHAMAYRLLAKMLHDRGIQPDGSSKLKYILLMGPSIWDNIHASVPEGDYLLTYQTEDEKRSSIEGNEYASNDYFGMMDESMTTERYIYTKMSLPVGHIPARTESEAFTAIRKIRQYIETPAIDSDIYNRVLLLGGDGDNNEFVIESEDHAASLNAYNPALNVDKVYSYLYATGVGGEALTLQKVMTSALKEGRYLVSYTGHASVEELKKNVMLWNRSLASSTQYSHFPIYVLGTCHTYSFDYPINDIGHSILFSPNGGAIATIAAGRTVYSNYNAMLNKSMSRALFDSARPGWCLGDAYMSAKSETTTLSSNDPDGLYNHLCYNLFGDPAIPLIVPSLHAVATSVADTEINPDFALQSVGQANARVGETIRLKGLISPTRSGAESAKFDGTVYISVFDGPISQNVTDGRVTVAVTTDEAPLLRTAAEVKNGEFTADFILPPGTSYGGMNRITFFAVSDDRSEFARGVCKAFSLLAPESEEIFADITAPSINAYINDETFTDGMTVGSSPVLYAEISDAESGVALSGAGLANSHQLSVDGASVTTDLKTLMRPTGNGRYVLSYPLGTLSDGNHRVEISVADNAGNVGSGTLYFRVADGILGATLTVAEEPAREFATIDLCGRTDASAEVDGTLIIRDCDGNTVRTVENAALPYVWNLKNQTGTRVPDGKYNAFMLLNSANLYGHTPQTSILVIK